MSSVEKVWLSRVGPEATEVFARGVRLSRIGATFGLAMILGFIVSDVANWNPGRASSYLIGVVGMVVCFTVSVRYQTRARRIAADYLRLPEGAWRFLSMRSPQRFDEWLARRQEPGWPRAR